MKKTLKNLKFSFKIQTLFYNKKHQNFQICHQKIKAFVHNFLNKEQNYKFQSLKLNILIKKSKTKIIMMIKLKIKQFRIQFT